MRNYKLTLTKLLIIFFAAIAADKVNAATFTVTNANDAGAGSLRQAISDAGAAAGDDTIAFDASFNTPRTITVASLITVNGNGALTINGSGTNLLTISGNNAVRVFEVTGIASPSIGTITFNNLTIANGFSPFSGAGNGAGIGVNNGASDPPANTVNLVVNNVLFRSNNGGVNPGGAIGATRNCTISVNNSAFTQNNANGGGAIANGSGIGTCGAVSILNSSFYENLDNTLSLGGNGNGVYTISGSSFYNNGSQSGGQIVFIQTSATTSTITNTTFFNNRALGGVIVLSLGTMTMRNVTISRNAANSDNVPGGIQMTNGAILNFGNSILSGNTSPSGENNISTNTIGFVSQGYNIVGNNFEPLTINGTTTGNLLNVNPLLDSTIRNNGGATPTVNLRPGSPAIDAGNPTIFPATDQRGIARPQDGDGNGTSRSDIGAFEKRLVDILPPAYDFDGDRKSDLSVFRPSNGVWYVQQSTAGFNGVAFGASSDSIVPADYDGDGKADLAVFRPSNGVWYIQQSTNGFIGVAFGTNGDRPVAGDYDGDGRADVAVFRPSNGTWYLNRSTQRFTGFVFGTNSDNTVPADYDGDGKTDVAVFRPNNGVWYLQQSTAGFIGVSFGTNGDMPAPADYDGDGKSDITVFRPSNGVWYLNRSTQGFTGIVFGANGDKPAPNAFVY